MDESSVFKLSSKDMRLIFDFLIYQVRREVSHEHFLNLMDAYNSLVCGYSVSFVRDSDDPLLLGRRGFGKNPDD